MLAQIRLALVVLRRRRFFTAVSLFGITVTIGVLLVATALLDHAFAPQYPEKRAGRMLLVSRVTLTGTNTQRSSGAGYGLARRPLRDLPGVETIAAVTNPGSVPLYTRGRPENFFVREADAAYWTVTDFDFLEGGPMLADDERELRRVAVISESARARLFGGAVAVGRTLAVRGIDYRIAGVVRDAAITRQLGFADIWLPLTLALSPAEQKEPYGRCTIVLLARDGADMRQIRAEAEARVRASEIPDPARFDTIEAPVDSYMGAIARAMTGSDRPGHPERVLFAVLAGLALAFMFLPAINLVNLSLSRILERAPEIGVRKSFGASSLRLVGQFVVENLVLTCVGAAIGVIAAAAALFVINRSGLVPGASFALNLRVLVWGVFITIVFGLLSGAWPAWRMARLDPVPALSRRSA